MTKVLILFLMISVVFTKYLVPSEIPFRYRQIRVPDKEKYEYLGKKYNYSEYYTPIRYKFPRDEGDEICSFTEKTVKFLYPSIWDNTSLLNPCEEFYCNQNLSFVFPLNNETRITLRESSFHQFRLITYCTLCQQTAKENFTETLKRRNCSRFESKCEKSCPSDTQCVYHGYYPICYSSTFDSFFRFYDFNHIVLMWVYVIGEKIAVVATFPFMLIYGIAFIFIPEIIYTFQSLKAAKQESRPFFSYIRILFSLRNQICFLLLVEDILSLLQPLSIL